MQLFGYSLKDLKAQTRQHVVLAILLIIYIVIDIKTPKTVTDLVDTMLGKLLVITAGFMFFNFNIVLGILGIAAAYQLIQRSSVASGTFAIRNYLPSEAQKVIDFSKYNDFPKTLEEEMVEKMAPPVIDTSSSPTNLDYKPVLDSLHDAAPVDYEGVI